MVLARLASTVRGRVKLKQLRAEPQLFVQEEHGVHGRVLIGVVALGQHAPQGQHARAGILQLRVPRKIMQQVPVFSEHI
jgi:hypothetical protein